MSYKLQFLSSALKEWKKIPPDIQVQFKKKLQERLEEPHVLRSKLSGAKNLYKIKLRSSGYRLAYQVHDSEIVVLVLSVGKRDKGDIYQKMISRLKK